MGNDFVVGYISVVERRPDAIKEVKTARCMGGRAPRGLVCLHRTSHLMLLKYQQEFANRGFKYQHEFANRANKDGSAKSTVFIPQLSSDKCESWWMLRRKTKSYLDLLEWIPKGDQGGCPGEKLESDWEKFLRYIPTRTEIRNGQMSRMLYHCPNAFAQDCFNQIDSIKNASVTVQTPVKTASTYLNSVDIPVCVIFRCSGYTVSAALNNEAASLIYYNFLGNIQAAYNLDVHNRKSLYYNLLGNIMAAYNLDGQILVPNTLRGIMHDGRYVTSEISMYANGTVTSERSLTPNLTKTSRDPVMLLKKHESSSAYAQKKNNAELSKNCGFNARFAMTAASSKVQSHLKKVQSHFKKEPQGTLINAIDAFDDFLNDFLR
ncbi:hypothetical protein CEK25_002365 [Fusarium fujikuroi]|nr:hypothetical protein CEK25_002365 [Fusarium fujikuroi]